MDSLTFEINLGLDKVRAEWRKAVQQMASDLSPLERAAVEATGGSGGGGNKRFEKMAQDFQRAMQKIDNAAARSSQKYGQVYNAQFAKMRTELQRVFEQSFRGGNPGATGMFNFREFSQQMNRRVDLFTDTINQEQRAESDKAKYIAGVIARRQRSEEELYSRLNKLNSDRISAQNKEEDKAAASAQKAEDKKAAYVASVIARRQRGEEELHSRLNKLNSDRINKQVKDEADLAARIEKETQASEAERLRIADFFANKRQEVENSLLRAFYLTEEQRVDLATRTNAKLIELSDRATTERLQDIKREVSAEIAAHQARLARLRVASRSGGGFGSATNTLFNIQQGLEDYRFAGIRGAANNISLIASQLAGNAGIYALSGLIAANIGLWVYELVRTEKKADDTNGKFAELLSGLQRGREHLKGMVDDLSGFSELARGSGLGEALGARRDLNAATRELEARQQEFEIIKRIKDAEASLDLGRVARNRGAFALLTGGIGGASRFEAGLTKLQRAQDELTSAEFAARRELGGAPLPEERATAFRNAQKSLEDQKQKVEFLRDELELQRSINRIYSENAGVVRRIDRIQEELTGTLLDQEFATSNIAKQYQQYQQSRSDSFLAGNRQLVDVFDAQRKAIADLLAQNIQNNGTEEDRNKLEEQYAELLEQQLQTLRRIRGEQEAQIAPTRDRLVTADKAADLAKEQLQIIRSQAQELIRRIEKEQELLKTLREQARVIDQRRSSSQLGFAQNTLSAQGSLASKQAEDQRERIQQQADAFRQRVQDQFDALGEAQQFFKGRKEAIDKFINAREKALLKGVESKLEATEKALFGKQQGLISDAADQAIKDAQKLVTGGEDPEQSKQAIENAIQLLEQLQQLQFDAAGDGNVAGFGNAAKTQDRIEGLLDLLATVNKQEQAAAAARQANAEQELERLRTRFAAVANIAEELASKTLVSDLTMQRAQQLLNIMTTIKGLTDGLANTLTPGLAGFDIQPRALGGPVSANRPYLVGERGPELFLPSSAGSIVPAQDTASLIRNSTTNVTHNNHTTGTVNNIGSVNVSDIPSVDIEGVFRNVGFANLANSRRSY